MSTPIRLAVFDCNDAIRRALGLRLAVDPRVSSVVVEDVRNQAAVTRAIDLTRPHAVLIDPRTASGGTSALPGLLSLRERLPYFVVGLHVPHQDYAEERAALAAGCDLYLLKGLKTEHLVDRVYVAIEWTTIATPQGWVR